MINFPTTYKNRTLKCTTSHLHQKYGRNTKKSPGVQEIKWD